LLGLDSISIDDDFFSLGGHSLLAVQAMTKIRDDFKIELPVKQLFEHPVLAKLAHVIDDYQHSEHAVKPHHFEVIERHQPLPLTLSQQRLWFLEKLTPNSDLYQIPLLANCIGDLNHVIFQQALDNVMLRHEILRSRFIDDNGKPHILINDGMTFPLMRVDARDKNDQMAETIIQSYLDSTESFRFDLSAGSIIYCVLFELSTQHHLLLINMHHIISDAHSTQLLINEIAVSYQSLLNNETVNLPNLPIQVVDYAHWQQQNLSDQIIQQQLNFWKNYLKGIPACISLPIDRPRPKMQTFEGDFCEIELDSTTCTAFFDCCKSHQLTPFMLLLSSYFVLLSRYSRQQDICVGVPVSGRHFSEIENLIGFFINALVIRADFTQNLELSDFFENIKESVLSAFAHQDIPAEQVIEAINPERSLSYPPLAQVAFSFQNSTDIDLELASLKFQPLSLKNSISKYDLTLHVVENNGSMRCGFEYNIALFDASTIETMLSHFSHTLKSIIDQPKQLIHQISLFDETALFDYLNLDNKDVEAIYPLSRIQHDLYLHSQLQPDTINNSLGYALDIHQAIEPVIWQQCIDHLVNQQAYLRSFLSTSHQPYCQDVYRCVAKQKHIELQWTDLSNEAEIDLQAFLNEKIYRPYDVTQDDLFSVFLIKVTDNHYSSGIIAHHLIFDGVCGFLHQAQMQKLYVKFYTEALQQQNNFFTHQPQWMEKLTQIKQQTDKLKASPNIYHQYVLEQQKTVDEVDTLFYWKQQLAHTNALDMMVKASKISTHRINNSLLIGAEHSQSLKTFCRQLKITPSVYFKAIYAFILQRYCQPDGDFFITEVLSSRQKQHYKAFGCYYQQVPMVFNADDFRPQQTIQSYLLKVKQQIRQLGHFKNISQSQLQQFLPESRLSFLYNFYNFPKQVDFLAQKTSIQQYIPPVAENQVQFIVQAIESEFQLDLYYFESEFNANELLIRMQFISQQILSQTHCLGELDLLSSVEKQQLKSLALIPEKIEFSSVQYQFEQQVKRTPELIAVKQGEQSLSYQQLNQQANQLAYYLKTKNIGANCCVGICLPAGIDILVAMLGILKAGGCYVPLDPNAPEQRLKTMINQISMTLLITTDENSVKAKLNNASAQTKLMPLWYELRETIEILYLEKLNQTLSNLPSDNLEHQTQATDLIYVIFTSGSTGTPKAAGVYHQGFSHLTQWYQQTFQWTTDDSTLIISSFSFDLTQKNLMTPLLCGASVVFAEHSHYDPTSLLSTCRKEKISWLNCAPSAFYPLIENTQNFVALKSLKQLILGGEVIQKSRINHWLQQMPTSFLLTNSYGPTECTDIALFHQIKGGSSISSIPLGQPIDRVQCYLLDNHNQPQPPGIVGEICIAGMGVGAGYINDAEKTQTSFTKLSLFSNDEQTIYHTGDAARINQFGQIEYIGRLDNQVKIRGLRIEIGEIENTLIHLAAIKQAVVVVQNDKLLAYLVVEDRVIPQEDEFCLSTIKQALSNQLTTAMCPSDYLVLDELPLMANGKIDRQRLKTADKSTLPVSLLHSSETNKTIIAASTNTEEILLEQWKSLLGLEKISMDDDFFELGGHSLLATQSAAKIRQQFKIDLPLKSLFEASTIAGLAKAIDTAIEQQPTQHQAIGKMPAQQSKILSFAQQRLWFLSQLDSQSSAYNIPLALRLKGKINEEALQSAIDTVVNRHEILRSNYVTDNGQATVKIQPSISVELEKISLFDLDKQQRQSKTIELAQQHAVHHFNLQTGSLIQVALAEFSKTDHVLLVNMHHIITDAWSAKILITELTIAYHHFLTHSDGQTLALPDLAIQYSDYAYWQQQFLSGEELDKQLSYWKKQLNNRPAVLNFPYDHPRPKVFTTNGNHINFQLPEKLSQQLQQLCQQQQTTLFMTLLAIFQSLLSRYTNQQEISVGTPIAGRQMAETQNLIGFFVNTLIIKTDLSGHPTFRELLQRVKQVTLDAFDHQELPFEQLVDALVDDRDMKIPPLAQAGFSFHHDEQLNLSFDGLDITPVELDYHTAKVDLLLIVSQSNNAIQATWEYNTDLLDDDTIKKLSHHFIRFCEAVCQNDQVQLCFQPLADEKELVEILAVADSDTQAIMPLNSIQRDLYLDSQLNPDTLYNSGGFSLIFDTLINAELWQQAIQWVTNQHLILKSSLQESHQSYLDPVYWVSHKTHTIELEYLADYCDILSPEDCQKLSKQRIEKTYKITQEKLLNHSLITSKSQQSLIILYGHHILLDGISIVFMLQQTLQAYEKLLHQQALHENPEHLYHKDLSFDQADKWLNSVLTPPQVFDQFQTIEFWKQRLIDVEPLHHYKPEKSANNEAVEQLLPISGKQFSALKKLSRQQKTTPVILLKSLYALLLNTLCRADSDFVIYEILAGRQRENRESIGCFYQQLPLVVKSDWLQAEQTLATFFNEIKNSQRQLKQNQYISVLAQTQLIPHAELNFFFNARHFMATMKIDDDSAIMQSYLQFPENQVQLILDLQSTSITCHLHYHSHLFNGAGFLQQLDYLLQQCLDNANSLHETSINQLSWITQVQKNQLCHVSKGAVSSQSNDETIISLIENQ
ncbi:MAG: amino acid adenylation domain-containing protein, partial [Methylococcales bacterium]|nr:amino acid adenylation domain-containing protein [Methylococcales bacterium]